MTIYIKNMVCNRCIRDVQTILNQLDLKAVSLNLGEVELLTAIDNIKSDELKNLLLANGFELIDNRQSQIIEKIKAFVIQQIHYKDLEKSQNFSDLISKHLKKDYPFLSNLFSSVEGLTIERYILLQKTEKIKELLVYGELNLNEIAFELGYSSVQHLSTQFKKITGLNPSHFKNLKLNKRNPLDKIL